MVIEEKEIDSLPITVDPDILGGTPVFRGTRVPVDALLNNLEAARYQNATNFRYDRRGIVSRVTSTGVVNGS